METLHRLGYRGPGSKPMASLSVRRAAPEISGNTRERMESVLANIRHMKDQAQPASDLRAEEAETLLHDQVMNCWRADSPTITAKGMPVEIVVTLTEAGALAGPPQTIDAQRLNSDRDLERKRTRMN